MAIRILTKNGIDNTNIDGARANNFNSGRRSGIVQGVLNEGRFFASSTNVIALDTCELRICGHRVVIDSVEYKTFTNTPSTPIRYSLVARISVDNNNDVTFELNTQTVDTPLVQDNLDNGAGVYDLEIGRFTLTTAGEIEDIVRTADLITGGVGFSGQSVNIGEVTTVTEAAGLDAEVDIDERYDEETNKAYIDFNFAIPQGATGPSNTLSIGTVTGGASASATITGSSPNQTLNLVLPKGDKGDKGDTGNTGASNTLSIGTVSSGASASATITGTSPNQTLNLVLPKGDKGDTGATGATGASGSNGVSVTGASAGTPTTSGNYTTTPITFSFSNGTSQSVNVSAQKGADGSITAFDLLWSGDLKGNHAINNLTNNTYSFLLIQSIWDEDTNSAYGIISCQNQYNNYGATALNGMNGARLWSRYAYNSSTKFFAHTDIGYDTTSMNETSGWGIVRIWGIKL